jgi:hypothetical protein
LKFCLSLVGRRVRRKEKERKEKRPEAFFPGDRTGHTLLAVLGRVFVAGKCK